jgi:membrane protein DedA with SNARE-associated domain
VNLLGDAGQAGYVVLPAATALPLRAETTLIAAAALAATGRMDIASAIVLAMLARFVRDARRARRAPAR